MTNEKTFKIEEARLIATEDPHNFDVLSTIVPDGLERRGLGPALMKKAFAYAHENGYALAEHQTCSFARAYLHKHPEIKTNS